MADCEPSLGRLDQILLMSECYIPNMVFSYPENLSEKAGGIEYDPILEKYPEISFTKTASIFSWPFIYLCNFMLDRNVVLYN